MNMPKHHIAFAAPSARVYHGRPACGIGIHRQDAGGTLQMERISRP